MGTHYHGEMEGAAAGVPAEPGVPPPAPIPPGVIRGTSRPQGQKTKVDYLTVTCRESLPDIHRCLEAVFGSFPAKPIFVPAPGRRHFEKSLQIFVAGMPSGFVLTGGQTQRGRACVDISGQGCAFVQDWERAEAALRGLPEHSWRRGDIAADFFRGEVTHERVKQAHSDGKFAQGGRGPKLSEILCSDETEGRTLYVGKRGGDAFGRFYEKGKKEFWSGANATLRKIVDSPAGVSVQDTARNGGEPFDMAQWYRAELELRSKNRDIPDDWITKRDEYFAGAYPFLAEILPEAEPRRILRPRQLGIVAIEKALATIKKQWGRVLYTGLAHCSGDYVELCMKILGDSHSPRLVAEGALLALEDDADA